MIFLVVALVVLVVAFIQWEFFVVDTRRNLLYRAVRDGKESNVKPWDGKSFQSGVKFKLGDVDVDMWKFVLVRLGDREISRPLPYRTIKLLKRRYEVDSLALNRKISKLL